MIQRAVLALWAGAFVVACAAPADRDTAHARPDSAAPDVSGLPAPVHPGRNDAARLDSALTEQATNILERYGDTFYVLGLYLAAGDGALRGIAARNWPALNAQPEAWRDSLLASFAEYRSQMHSAAFLLDRSRVAAAAESDSTFAVFHFETAAGLCLETLRRYDLRSDPAGVVWMGRGPLPCRSVIWPPRQ